MLPTGTGAKMKNQFLVDGAVALTAVDLFVIRRRGGTGGGTHHWPRLLRFRATADAEQCYNSMNAVGMYKEPGHFDGFLSGLCGCV